MKLLHNKALLLLIVSLNHSFVMAQNEMQMVRLAVIDVDQSQLDSYNDLLKEEIKASIANERGVITLYGVADMENPAHVTLFETYADSNQYKSHLSTSHFQKYKQGTLQMVKHLELIETKPVLYIRKPELTNAKQSNLYVRLVKLELNINDVDNFFKLVKDVMFPGLKEESGILVMYAVSKKNEPSQITILEVYTNKTAYENHIQTSHFLKYKTASVTMVKSLKLIDVNPIYLGSKL